MPAATGRKPHDIVAVTALCFFKEAMSNTYDDLAADLAACKDWYCDQFAVDRLPSRSATHRGMAKLSQKYIRKVNNLITGIQ